MATERFRAPSAEASVASCIMDIIQAFANALHVFNKFRERRKRRRARGDTQAPGASTSAEVRLCKSLRKGAEELYDTYAQCYCSGAGPMFARGDDIAHASLAETVVKLNTGLVGIITSFLGHDKKSSKSHMRLDYSSLTNLSDASRREALHSMAQLCQRMSYSQLQLPQPSSPACAHCRGPNNTDCPSHTGASGRNKRDRTSSRQRASGPLVTRMPLKSSSQAQLVIMRPKAPRKTMSSARNPTASAPARPRYVAMSPIELPTTGVIKGTMGVARASAEWKVNSLDAPRPSPWPLHHKSRAPSPFHSPAPKPLRHHAPVHEKSSTQTLPTARHHARDREQNSTQAPPALPIKRRIDKTTPSSHTFASDSTQLGEIPQRHWTRPWDYEEASRLNSEAALTSLPTMAASTAKVARKKGLFTFLRRGSVASGPLPAKG